MAIMSVINNGCMANNNVMYVSLNGNNGNVNINDIMCINKYHLINNVQW